MNIWWLSGIAVTAIDCLLVRFKVAAEEALRQQCLNEYWPLDSTLMERRRVRKLEWVREGIADDGKCFRGGALVLLLERLVVFGNNSAIGSCLFGGFSYMVLWR